MPGDKLWNYFGPYFGLISHKHTHPSQVDECKLCIKWIKTHSPDEKERVIKPRKPRQKKTEKNVNNPYEEQLKEKEIEAFKNEIARLKAERAKEQAFNEYVAKGKLQDFPCPTSTTGNHAWQIIRTLAGLPNQEICNNCGATRIMGGQQYPDYPDYPEYK